MARKLGSRGSGFKAKVALAAFKGDKTLAQLAQEFSSHTTQISTWKQRLLEGARFAGGLLSSNRPALTVH